MTFALWKRKEAKLKCVAVVIHIRQKGQNKYTISEKRGIGN